MIALPSDEFDKLMKMLDTPTPAPNLKRQAHKKRRFLQKEKDGK